MSRITHDTSILEMTYELLRFLQVPRYYIIIINPILLKT